MAFLAGDLFTTAFLAAAFLAGDFFTTAFLAAAFLAGDFFTTAFLAVAFLAGDFFTTAFLAAAFLIGSLAISDLQDTHQQRADHFVIFLVYHQPTFYRSTNNIYATPNSL